MDTTPRTANDRRASQCATLEKARHTFMIYRTKEDRMGRTIMRDTVRGINERTFIERRESGAVEFWSPRDNCYLATGQDDAIIHRRGYAGDLPMCNCGEGHMCMFDGFCGS